MKRLKSTGIISVCIIMLLSLSGCAQKQYAFRNADMGMTKADVLKSEEESGDPYISDDGRYIYTGVDYANLVGTAVYSFDDADALSSILFIADEAYIDHNAFSAIVDHLVERYDEAVYVDAEIDETTGDQTTTMQWTSDEEDTYYILLVWTTDTSLSLYYIQIT